VEEGEEKAMIRLTTSFYKHYSVISRWNLVGEGEGEEKSKSYPCNMPWKPIRFLGVEAPGLQMAVKLSALRAGRSLPPPEDF
jgi:hypothetical protein